jgi:hypothetical protein
MPSKKKIDRTAIDNLSLGRLVHAKVYNPPYEHAYEAFHDLSKVDKARALQGADERNLENYDIIKLKNKNADMMGPQDFWKIRGASEEQIRSDFMKMDLEYPMEHREIRQKDTVAGA